METPVANFVSANQLNAITANSESGNRDFFAPGRPVVSSAGARFAMQVMPSTARDPGFGLRPANPNDPADMNRLGGQYRAAMQQRYGGDPAKMWAAYNAGPGAVTRWLENSKCAFDEFVEMIPFQETRGNVKRVLRFYAAYAYLYENADSKALRVSLLLSSGANAR